MKKIPCGGFMLGDGLTLDGNVLNATGGDSSELPMKYIGFAYDEDSGLYIYDGVFNNTSRAPLITFENELLLGNGTITLSEDVAKRMSIRNDDGVFEYKDIRCAIGDQIGFNSATIGDPVFAECSIDMFGQLCGVSGTFQGLSITIRIIDGKLTYKREFI